MWRGLSSASASACAKNGGAENGGLPGRDARVYGGREDIVTRDELKKRLKALLVEGLRLESTRPEDIQDAEPIFVDGLGLDSIDALELAVLVEDHFQVSISDEEVGKVAFASIDALADFILGQQGEAPV